MCDKVGMTEAEAKRVIHDCKRKYITKYGDVQKPTHKIPRRAYYCKECHSWHVSKVRNPKYYAENC